MGYNPEKDKTVKVYKPVYADETDKITVGIYEYNESEPKVGIMRTKLGQAMRLGRLSFTEAKYLKRALADLLKSQGKA